MSPLSFNFNPAVLAISRSLNTATDSLRRVSERLASGQRINRASDDAAGLAVSSSLLAQSRIYSQGVRNANDAISALNIADGSLDQMSSMITRMRELAIQTGSGTVSSTQRRSLNAEAQALASEFQRVQSTSQFNGIQLVGNSQQSVGIQIGSGRFGSMNINLGVYGTGSNSSTSAGDGISSFDSPTAYTGNSTLYGVGDVNGDGMDDLIVASDAEQMLKLSPSNGSSFDATSWSISYSGSAVVMAVADFNGDDIADVLLGNDAGEISVYRGLGGGGGTMAYSSGLSVTPLSAAKPLISDMDGDGYLDVVVASGNQIITLLNDQTGNFFESYSSKLASGPITSIAAGQFTGSSDKDIVVSTSTFALQLLTGNGSGDYSAISTLGFTGVRVDAAGDLNGDGYDDFVNASGTALQVRGGNGAGGFSLLSSNTTGGAGDLAFGDFNNDGKKDLGVFDGADTNYFLLGNGDGSFSNFTASSPSAFGGYLTQLRIGDIDGNGYSDAFLNGGSAIVAFIASPSDTSSTTTTTTAALGSFSLTTASGALSALATLDAAMDKITATRGLVGSSLSRLDSALHTTQATKDNYEAAASRIHDADIGSEAANYVRLNLLQKTGAALLAHANQLPGLLLDLLRPD